MPRITHYLPELDQLEEKYIENLVDGLSREEAQLFAEAYRQRRKDPHTVLLTGIVALVAIPGLQRFWLGQVGMGFLYLFTVGFLWVGTIIDLIRYKHLAFLYNQSVGQQIVNNLHSMHQTEASPIRRTSLLHA